MCFSAEASFTASAALALIGGLTARTPQRPRERMFGSIPLLFAVQQFIEGFVWLSFDHDVPMLNVVATHVYSMFSHVLWPTLVPLSVWLIEPYGWRRRALAIFTVAGALVSAWLLYSTTVHGVVSVPRGEHIEYVTSSALARTSTVLYVLATAVSMLLSTHRMVRVFGAVALLSLGLVQVFYARWFISVWCYVAALLSTIVYLHFKLDRTLPPADLGSAAGPFSRPGPAVGS